MEDCFSSASSVRRDVVVKLGARNPNFTIKAVCGGLGKDPLLPNLGTGQLNHRVPKQPGQAGREGWEPKVLHRVCKDACWTEEPAAEGNP